VEDKQRSFLFISSSRFLKNVGDFSKNMGDFSKNVGVFGRISDIFCSFLQGVATCVAALWLKKWSVVIG